MLPTNRAENRQFPATIRRLKYAQNCSLTVPLGKLVEQLRSAQAGIKDLEATLLAWHRSNAASRRLATIVWALLRYERIYQPTPA